MDSMTWDIIGHEWATELLKRHIVNNDVRHAYLFTGTPGTGRRTLALRFAQALNCASPKAPGEPCGQCRICKQIERMQQPDLLVIMKPEDRTEIIIDQIRELEYKLNLSPYESHYRIGLLIQFENANVNAQNALLKPWKKLPIKQSCSLQPIRLRLFCQPSPPAAKCSVCGRWRSNHYAKNLKHVRRWHPTKLIFCRIFPEENPGQQFDS